MTNGLTWSDERLLDELIEAFDPGRTAPSEECIRAMRAVVTDRYAPRPRWRGRRDGRRRGAWVALVVAAGTTTVGAGAAFAGGTPLPEPVRVLAHVMGLPVDSPAVSSTRHAEKALQSEIDAASSPSPSRVVAIDRDALALSHRVAALGAGDRARLGRAPQVLLSEAQHLAAQAVPRAPDPGRPRAAAGRTKNGAAAPITSRGPAREGKVHGPSAPPHPSR